MSRGLQNQMYIFGASGLGMKQGLINVLKSETLYQAKSGSDIIEIYNADGTRKTDDQITNEGTKLASSWVSNLFGKFSEMVGKSPAFSLIGRTSDNTEYQRSYTFHFIDAGLHEFDPDVDYCVVNGQVQPCGGEGIQ
jgi:hypothetical protein